jgi:hypothetical protein
MQVAVNVFDNANVCMSGGAIGADLQWGMCAGMAGHQVIHWSFDGHKSDAPETELVRIPYDLLILADEHLKVANVSLERKLPFDKPWVINLLRRNYYQVGNSNSVYAVSTIKKGKVQGGTAWATQMYLDLHPENPECYVFDQDEEVWYKREHSDWTAIEAPPSPSGIWAGVGTRDLNQAGKQAIRALMGYTPLQINS